MNIIKRVTGLFSVMEDEVKSFRLLFLQSLFIGFANSYYYIVSSSFLLKNVSIRILPNAYIITGTAGFLLIQLYKRLQKRYGITGSFKAVLIIFSMVCCMNFFAMMELSHNKAFAVFLAYFMVLFAAPFTAIFSLGLFAQCSRMYNIAQSKRLLALIISGEIVASVLAFLSIPFMGALIKGRVYVLLPFAGLFILLVFIPFNRILALAKDRFQAQVSTKAPPKVDLKFLLKDKFYTYIGITTVFSVFAIYSVDYVYLISVRYMVDISGYEIAQIVAVFFFSVKIGELVFSFLSGSILSKKGVLFSLLLLPVALLLLSVFACVSGYLFAGLPVFLLAFLFLSKLVERAVRKAVTTPSVKVMYQVAEPHERLEIESSIDGLLNQVATVVSGVLLLVISLLFFHGDGDKVALLKVFSLVGIVVFALWAFLSVKMYDSYRVKISEFLSRVKQVARRAGQDGKAARIADGADHDHELLFEKADKMILKIRGLKKHELLDMIRMYNSKQSLDFRFEKDDKIARRLIHVYYNNQNYISRLLIAMYLPYFNEQTAQSFLGELWEVSDIIGRLELVMAFNGRKFKGRDQALFERLCEECVGEIAWAESCANDVAELKNDDLDREIQYHRSILVRLLFELLKVLYDSSVIDVIYGIITNEEGDIENRLFAIELLDITLHPGLKEMIKPILEPVAFENRKQKLGKFFHVYSLSARDRLIDILMKDYNLISLKLKETALVVYSKVSDNKHVLAAFRTNSIGNLKSKAEAIYDGFSDPLYLAKLEVLKLIESRYEVMKPYTPYLFNHGISIPGRRRGRLSVLLGRHSADHEYTIEVKSSSGVAVKLDYLGLALLISLKQSGYYSNEVFNETAEIAMESV